VDLLAFHRRRLDSGPGCRPTDPGDAAHFSARAPYPTLQLLVVADLVRSGWFRLFGQLGEGSNWSIIFLVSRTIHFCAL
jgi:hypothetical protein